ncbi:MAG TPA: STAS domain-containing protein [Gammaproteobacteria bacterium]|nr:STAS domain-containing protein [Gammaproteobacteria bacterium]
MASVEVISVEGGYQLEGTLNLWTMGPRLALDFSSSGDLCHIDLGHLVSPDSGVIVQMLSWIRAANEQHVDLAFVNTPEQLVSLIDLYDLESIIKVA